MHNNSDTPKQPSMQEIMRIAQTPEGQKIISILKNQNDPRMKQAMSKAAQGDYSQAKEVLSTLLSNAEMKELLSRLGGN